MSPAASESPTSRAPTSAMSARSPRPWISRSRIGEVLLSSGAGASDVSAAMNNVARACGLRGFTADVMFTELTMSQQSSPEQPALIQIRQVRYREVDYGDLTGVDHLIRDLVAGQIDRAEATDPAEPDHLHRPLASAVVGHRGARRDGRRASGWCSAATGWSSWWPRPPPCSSTLMQRQMGRRRLPVFYQQVAGGLLATLIAVGVAATPADVSPSLVISTSIVMLLAGVNFLGAIQDALTGFPVTAGARILEAFLATAGVVAGVSGGLQVGRRARRRPRPVDPGAYSIADVPVMVVGGAIAAARLRVRGVRAARARRTDRRRGRCRGRGLRRGLRPRLRHRLVVGAGRTAARPGRLPGRQRAPGSRRWSWWPPASRRSCPASRSTAG